MILQAVVDHNYLFRDICTGCQEVFTTQEFLEIQVFTDWLKRESFWVKKTHVILNAAESLHTVFNW